MDLKDVPKDRALRGAIDEAVGELKTRDPAQLAGISGGKLEGNKLITPMLNGSLVLDLGSGDVVTSEGEPANPDTKVLLLHYVLSAQGALDGKWASYREFVGGDLYYSVFYGRAILPLVARFGEKISDLDRAGTALGGSKVGRGDVSYDFLFFPYLLLNVTVWEGDDEVPASANILFDSAAGQTLPAEDLAHLAANLTNMLVRAAKE